MSKVNETENSVHKGVSESNKGIDSAYDEPIKSQGCKVRDDD
jgi:hypothetical protein